MDTPILRATMLPFLLYQRTHYSWPAHRLARRFLAPLKLYGLYWRFAAPIIERARKPAITREYGKELTRELNEIKPHLPTGTSTILDIGCGLAGIDLWLYQHYQSAASLHLLDKEGLSPVYYGFGQEAAHYSKSALTKAFLLDNGVAEKSLFFYDAQKNEFPSDTKFDLVLSLISWGFHYPIDTYLENVTQVLRPDGRVILDVRKGTDGMSKLAKQFRSVLNIAEDRKRFRVLAGNQLP